MQPDFMQQDFAAPVQGYPAPVQEPIVSEPIAAEKESWDPEEFYQPLQLQSHPAPVEETPQVEATFEAAQQGPQAPIAPWDMHFKRPEPVHEPVVEQAPLQFLHEAPPIEPSNADQMAQALDKLFQPSERDIESEPVAEAAPSAWQPQPQPSEPQSAGWQASGWSEPAPALPSEPSSSPFPAPIPLQQTPQQEQGHGEKPASESPYQPPQSPMRFRFPGFDN
ncbi:MAG: hypothetical protein R3E96_12960 [Planctomycetota bacterium]